MWRQRNTLKIPLNVVCCNQMYNISSTHCWLSVSRKRWFTRRHKEDADLQVRPSEDDALMISGVLRWRLWVCRRGLKRTHRNQFWRHKERDNGAAKFPFKKVKLLPGSLSCLDFQRSRGKRIMPDLFNPRWARGFDKNEDRMAQGYDSYYPARTNIS